jgi:two-component system, LuxR family, response regulator FixJ
MASRVFIVDDDAAVRKALDRLLRGAGYTTDLCASAEEYLQREPVAPPACLLLDIRMAGMSGLDLQRTIRGTPRALPVVVITGHGNDTDREQALALGAVDVLDKPLDHVVLLAAIERALARSHGA